MKGKTLTLETLRKAIEMLKFQQPTQYFAIATRTGPDTAVYGGVELKLGPPMLDENGVECYSATILQSGIPVGRVYISERLEGE